MTEKCRRMVVQKFGLTLTSYIFMCLLIIRIAAMSGLGMAGWAWNAPERQTINGLMNKNKKTPLSLMKFLWTIACSDAIGKGFEPPTASDTIGML